MGRKESSEHKPPQNLQDEVGNDALNQTRSRKKDRAPKHTKRLITDILMIAILVVGVIALLYPFVSDKVNEILDQQIITYYQNKANKENEAALAKVKAEQEAKNKKLAKEGSSPGADPFSDERKKVKEKPTPDYYQTHTIGIIRIPKINVKLPIFDETTDLFLSKGTSLLEGTSYPTGGNDTHSVISGHRGLPEAKLFTDLPDLKAGDHFYIEINDETHAYEVDQLKVIEPTETEDLHIEAGKDLVTLLTCTPYMINSHRLLVRGHRIPYVPAMKTELAKSDNHRKLYQILILGGAILILLLLLWLFSRWLRGVLIKGRRYEMRFEIQDEAGRPLSGMQFALYSKNGKIPVQRDGEQLAAVTDAGGRFLIPDVRGGRYLVKAASDDKLIFKAKVAKPKAQRFTLTPVKQSPVRSVKVDQDHSIFIISH